MFCLHWLFVTLSPLSWTLSTSPCTALNFEGGALSTYFFFSPHGIALLADLLAWGVRNVHSVCYLGIELYHKPIGGQKGRWLFCGHTLMSCYQAQYNILVLALLRNNRNLCVGRNKVVDAQRLQIHPGIKTKEKKLSNLYSIFHYNLKTAPQICDRK